MFSVTNISEGKGVYCRTFTLSENDEKIQKFSCWFGLTFFIGDFHDGKWTFYAMGHPHFNLPENILKKFQAKGKLLK
jgi:hypothetical protein